MIDARLSSVEWAKARFARRAHLAGQRWARFALPILRAPKDIMIKAAKAIVN